MLAEGDIEVQIRDEAELPQQMSEFTEQVFRVLNRPGVMVHPRAFLRAVDGRKRKPICPASWPTPSWARAVIEQIVMDTSGMQVRFWDNNKPWLAQPAIYCDCFMAITESRQIADKWLEEQRERKRAAEHGR